MSRTELLDNNYKFEQKQPKRSVIMILRASLAAVFIALSAQISVYSYIFDNADRIHLSNNIVMLIFLAIILAYYILRVGMMSLFCQYKKNSIATFKVLEEGGISIFTCREALRMWQIILIYTIPAASAYSALSIMVVLWTFESVFLFFMFLTSVAMACDFTIAIYILFIKAAYKPDYIAINHHIYNLTLYTNKY